MPEPHLPAYLSASRLACYEWCPAEYEQRYMLKVPVRPTMEMVFGTAVHAGAEAHYRGHDDELTFLRTWRASIADFDEPIQSNAKALTARGLELLAMVRELGFVGESEYRITMTVPGINTPFLGYIDLWSEGHIVDFKTTAYGWSQTKADRQVFQPAIYAQAHSEVFGSIPRFTYVVLSRAGGPVQLVDGTRTPDQIIAAFDRAKEILRLIEARVFPCTCKRHLEQTA